MKHILNILNSQKSPKFRRFSLSTCNFCDILIHTQCTQHILNSERFEYAVSVLSMCEYVRFFGYTQQKSPKNRHFFRIEYIEYAVFIDLHMG